MTTVLRAATYVTYTVHMNTKAFGSFRQIYVTALRTISAVTILAVGILVVAQNFTLWMPNMYR